MIPCISGIVGGHRFVRISQRRNPGPLRESSSTDAYAGARPFALRKSCLKATSTCKPCSPVLISIGAAHRIPSTLVQVDRRRPCCVGDSVMMEKMARPSPESRSVHGFVIPVQDRRSVRKYSNTAFPNRNHLVLLHQGQYQDGSKSSSGSGDLALGFYMTF